MSSFLTRAIDAQVRVELVRDLFKLEGLEPVPEDVALALEDDDVAREEIISFVVARFRIFIGVVVYVVVTSSSSHFNPLLFPYLRSTNAKGFFSNARQLPEDKCDETDDAFGGSHSK